MTMRKSIGMVATFLLLGLTASFANAAESKAVQSMAGILLKLNHFPSAAEKETLKQIVEDKATTDDERTVAQALMNVQHTVVAADKPKLEAIVADDEASSAVKSLATAILNLRHAPAESDKATLQSLTGQ
jgi:hypothetical protein